MNGCCSIATVALIALLTTACSGKPAAPAEGQGRASGQAAAAPREVRLARVVERELAQSLLVTGTLAADEQVSVGVKVAGRLASIAVDLGSVVKRGQQIAQIETTDYQLRVEQALSALGQARALLGLSPEGGEESVEDDKTSLVREARATLDEARAGLERSRSLVEQRLIPQADFDTAQATFVRAETGLARAHEEIRTRKAALRQREFELRSARQQLADTAVRSPLDGTVQQRLVQAGEYLAAGANVAIVVRVDPLRLRVDVPERDAALVRSGQTVRVSVDGDEQKYDGQVVRLAPGLAAQNRTLAVEAEIQNPGSLRPGSFARAEIVVDSATRAAVVPTSAVVTFAGIEKVITVENGKAVEKEITTGRRTAQWTEVLSGAGVGDAVVVEPGNLQQGQRVTIRSTS